jgi:hypothetical protein
MWILKYPWGLPVPILVIFSNSISLTSPCWPFSLENLNLIVFCSCWMPFYVFHCIENKIQICYCGL